MGVGAWHSPIGQNDMRRLACQAVNGRLRRFGLNGADSRDFRKSAARISGRFRNRRRSGKYSWAQSHASRHSSDAPECAGEVFNARLISVTIFSECHALCCGFGNQQNVDAILQNLKPHLRRLGDAPSVVGLNAHRIERDRIAGDEVCQILRRPRAGAFAADQEARRFETSRRSQRRFRRRAARPSPNRQRD